MLRSCLLVLVVASAAAEDLVSQTELTATPEAKNVVSDQGPVRKSTPELAGFYPNDTRKQGITGKSTLRLSVTDEGWISSVSIVDSTPAGIFDQAAKQLGCAYRYLPARKNGQPVAADVTLTVIWTLEP